MARIWTRLPETTETGLVTLLIDGDAETRQQSLLSLQLSQLVSKATPVATVSEAFELVTSAYIDRTPYQIIFVDYPGPNEVGKAVQPFRGFDHPLVVFMYPQHHSPPPMLSYTIQKPLNVYAIEELLGDLVAPRELATFDVNATNQTLFSEKEIVMPSRATSELGANLAFLCHSSGDKERVRALYRDLTRDGVRCWFDEEDLLPGQNWELEIRKGLKASKYVLACLSQASITKAGFVQKELKQALDRADEQPEGSVFLVPVRLEECEIPDRLQHIQYVDLFEARGYERLLRTLGGEPNLGFR